jgi:FkbM family methyltransferase
MDRNRIKLIVALSLVFCLILLCGNFSSNMPLPSVFFVERSVGLRLRKAALEGKMSVDQLLEVMLRPEESVAPQPKQVVVASLQCPTLSQAMHKPNLSSLLVLKEIDEVFRPIFIPRYKQASLLPKRSYSQCGQDAVVLGLLEKEDGRQKYFVDLACNHAYRMSNSYALESFFGWKGICADANYQYWYDVAKYRNCHVIGGAVSSKTGDEVTFAFRGSYGGIVSNETDNQGSGVTIPTISFDTILTTLKFPRVIDYLSLDVEGAESFVFQGIDLSVTKFLVITIERPKPDLRKKLEAAGYALVWDLGWFGETLWLSKELFPDWQKLKTSRPDEIAYNLTNVHFSATTFCKDTVVSNCV